MIPPPGNYAAGASKVIQAYFHAAAFTGRTIEHVLEWIAPPTGTTEPGEILREHPHAARFWAGLLQGALHGDHRTVGNTITTCQQALALFFQPDIRQRCVPSAEHPATDVESVIKRGGTFHLLGREDPYASVSPLMTALAEHILDTALVLANRSECGRLYSPMLPCLDELPSTAPLPTLRTRMANERTLRISFVYAAQTWRQLTSILGQDEAQALFGLTNVMVVFGGSKTTRSTATSPNSLAPSGLPAPACTPPAAAATSPPTTPRPATRESPPTPRTSSPRDRRERQSRHRQAPPLHRRKAGAEAPRRATPVARATHISASGPARGGRCGRSRPHRGRSARPSQGIVDGRKLRHLRNGDPAVPLPGPQLRQLYRHHWTAENGSDKNGKRPGSEGQSRVPGIRQLWGPRHSESRCGAGWRKSSSGSTTRTPGTPARPSPPAGLNTPLIHEIALMAGDRYRAGQAHDGGPLENWHRVCVPWFRSRMREGTQSHCEERRQAWPARERYARHVSDLDFQQRWLRAEEDIVAVGILPNKPWIPLEGGDELNVVTGEIKNAAEGQELLQEAESRQTATLGQDTLPLGTPAVRTRRRTRTGDSRCSSTDRCTRTVGAPACCSMGPTNGEGQ